MAFRSIQPVRTDAAAAGDDGLRPVGERLDKGAFVEHCHLATLTDQRQHGSRTGAPSEATSRTRLAGWAPVLARPLNPLPSPTSSWRESKGIPAGG